MAVKIQIRNGTANEWTTHNPLLMEGELAIENDTKKVKIGDGITNWNSLSYMTQGLKGDTGEQGEKGEPFVYADFTPQQLINLKGEKGDTGDTGLRGYTGETGKGLQFTWDGTQLGVRVEGTSTYNYTQLKGEKGDTGETGSVENLTSTHISTALGYTPFNAANFVDTTYTAGSNVQINGTVISATDTTYTKASLGLENVDNLKQMPISGGVLENYREKLTTVTGAINLSLGNVFFRNATANTTFSITNAVSGQAHSFTLIIEMGATIRTLSFPASVKWQGGEIPDLTTASKTYVLTFLTINGGTNWLGMFGGEF